ncbi:hypothetical protein BJ508DRAFT_325641 [Ascobolus immersus RN42]|uniref:Uncharacterized protein n=1 Tax=Ascobolus immersus RN42 TaxID=1160509 RepID=A0A3N4I8H8_ASCIM|nr:hypothetical protein BJ508DRAFT_325641 [Ascobolus immersus RN42]
MDTLRNEIVHNYIQTIDTLAQHPAPPDIDQGLTLGNGPNGITGQEGIDNHTVNQQLNHFFNINFHPAPTGSFSPFTNVPPEIHSHISTFMRNREIAVIMCQLSQKLFEIYDYALTRESQRSLLMAVEASYLREVINSIPDYDKIALLTEFIAHRQPVEDSGLCLLWEWSSEAVKHSMRGIVVGISNSRNPRWRGLQRHSAQKPSLITLFIISRFSQMDSRSILSPIQHSYRKF